MNTTWTADEMMTIAAARTLKDGNACFVGIGIPSTAAILAKSMQAPNLFLIYESGTVNTNPQKLPLSIGDGELANHALTVVGMPEIFNYWLQSGRIDVGFLGAAQIDRFANINTTFIGQTYDSPKVRLPGAGGATEIAASCKEVAIIIRQTTRTFVKQVDFVTSMGFGDGPGSREKNRLRGGGPSRVITDLGILEPDPKKGTDTGNNYVPSDSKGVKVNLNPGDMLVYRGCDLEHWRNKFEGENCGQVFLHYNDSKSKLNKDNVFDSRSHLGLPNWFKGRKI